MEINPAIIISAYNRPASLQRLLASVANAVYESDSIELIISIDKSDASDVEKIANQFEWKHGRKIIIAHTKHLGLKEHILSCGDLALKYGAVILLEDDLYVSPYFYSYAKQAQAFYTNDPGIAGISLYNYQVAESCFYPFHALDDGSDVYFMQVASSWGQLWTKEQWSAFKGWLSQNPDLPVTGSIPGYLQAWGPHSWKKHFIHYLIDTNRYFVFPRMSLSTNFEDAGTHASTKNTFQVPLQLASKDYTFKTLKQSGAVYDAWFEILPSCLNAHNQQLSAYDYTVDLYGSKNTDALKSSYILTSKRGEHAVLSFGNPLFPFELNIALNTAGEDIGLYKKDTALVPVKLKARNILGEQKKEAQEGISIIIPVDALEQEKIKATLDSIASQAFENKECVLVVDASLSIVLKKITQSYPFPVKIIYSLTAHTMEERVSAGFENATKGILTYTMPASTLAPDILEKIVTVFTSNMNISWVKGIDETLEDHTHLSVRNYRLTTAEAYARLAKNDLDLSMELNFFRAHCLPVNGKPLSFKHLFFDMIAAYQLIIVVAKFGNKINSSPVKLTSAEQAEFLKHYAHFKATSKPGVAFVDWLLNKAMPSAGISQWFYTSVTNFPDVLRYDAAHGTFYFSRS